MQVRHRFATVRAVVDDEPVAGFFPAEFGSAFGGFEQEMAEQFLIVRLRFGDARNRLLWKNQNVRRGLRIDVVNGEDEVVFKNDLRRNFAGGDFFKQGFAHFDFNHEMTRNDTK